MRGVVLLEDEGKAKNLGNERQRDEKRGSGGDSCDCCQLLG